MNRCISSQIGRTIDNKEHTWSDDKNYFKLLLKFNLYFYFLFSYLLFLLFFAHPFINQIVFVLGAEIIFSIHYFLKVSLSYEIDHLPEFKNLKNENRNPKHPCTYSKKHPENVKYAWFEVLTVGIDRNKMFLELICKKKSDWVTGQI